MGGSQDAFAQGFEGRATYRLSIAGEERPPATYVIKGRRFRQDLDTPSGVSVMIVDEVARTATILEPGRADPMVAPLGPVSSAALVVVPLAQSDSIAGLQCSAYRIQQGSNEAEVCVSFGLGVTSGGVLPPAFGIEDLASSFSEGFFPLRTREATPRGLVEIEAVEVEQGPVPDEVFEIRELPTIR